MATITLTHEPSSSNSDIELQAPSTPYFSDQKRASHFEASPSSQQILGNSTPEIATQNVPPENAVEALQKWNTPRINMHRVFATFWSFFLVGMNDGSYGVSLIRISHDRTELIEDHRLSSLMCVFSPNSLEGKENADSNFQA